MSQVQLVAVKCRISEGSISDVRGFDITLPDGGTYGGIAYQQYFWNNRGEQIRDDEPSGDEEIDGMIAARYLGDDEDGNPVASIPDGEVISVAKDLIMPRPVEAASRASI